MIYKNCVTIWDVETAPREIREIAKQNAKKPKFIAFVKYPGIKQSSIFSAKSRAGWYFPKFGWPKIIEINNTNDYFVVFTESEES